MVYQLENVNIKGAEGRIQGKYLRHRNVQAPCVLVCGPLTEERESLGNVSLSSIFKLYGSNGYNVLYFSYRGTGGSEGCFEDLFDGVADALTCFDWLTSKNDDSREFSVVGVQYGSSPALEILTRRPEINEFLLINPSYDYITLNHIMNHQASGQILIDDAHFKNKKESAQKLKKQLEFNNTGTVQLVVVNPSLPALELASQLG